MLNIHVYFTLLSMQNSKNKISNHTYIDNIIFLSFTKIIIHIDCLDIKEKQIISNKCEHKLSIFNYSYPQHLHTL